MSPEDGLLVVSANFGGGVDSLRAAGDSGRTRVDELARLVLDPAGDGSASGRPCVAVVQEMTRLLEPSADLPRAVEDLLGDDSRSFFLTCNTTERYPWEEKWGRRWAEEGIVRMEEGMGAFSARGCELSNPAGAPENDFRGLALDLPIVEFAAPDAAGDWIEHDLELPGGYEARLRFRPSYYRGNRDTDPRAASAHRVRTRDGAELIVVNVHLATLRNENREEERALPGDGAARVVRTPTPEATFLRFLHMSVIRDFVARVYAELKLPVVVAGDFNATPDAPELQWLAGEVALRTVFDADGCWSCGRRRTIAATPQMYWTDADARNLLARSQQEVLDAGGTAPVQISSTENCAGEDCRAPLFTHKLHFALIDNLLYTDPAASAELGLRFRIEGRGLPHAIVENAHFSDHLPVFAELGLEPC